MSFLFFAKKEWLIILILGPVLIFVLAMIDVPLYYWVPAASIILPEWIHYYSVVDIIDMGKLTILVGIILGLCIVILKQLSR